MALTLQDIINQARTRLDDTGTTGVLWTDEDIITYANNGEQEICKRALALKDTTTAAVSEITLIDGQGLYSIDPRVLFVQRASVRGQYSKLRRIDLEKLDTILGWESKTGIPTYFSTDFQDGSMLVMPTPVTGSGAGEVIDMVVLRLPLATMVNLTDTPEINESYHQSIVDWVCFEAYSKNDADSDSADKAQKYYGLFESAIGAHKTASTFIVSQRKYPKNIESAKAIAPSTQSDQ